MKQKFSVSTHHMPSFISLAVLNIILFAAGLFSCKKFVTVSPPVNQLVAASVFTSDATATAAVVGIYSQMMRSNGFTSGYFASINNLTGISADELSNYAIASDLAPVFATQ